MSWLVVAAVLGVTGVIAGAFGAHGLRATLEPAQLSAWETGALYQIIHSVAILALALFSESTGRSVTWPAGLMAGGVVLFSGSIYVLALGGPRFFGPITPLGGIAFIAGWASLALTLRN